MRKGDGLFGRYKEELSVISRYRSCFCCSLLTLKLCALNLFSHPSFIGLLFALCEFPIMTRDNAVTKTHIGRGFRFSQQLKFRGALSVKPHPHKIV
jgi:hypothetical protein